jgi:hypothetical protein
MKKALQSAFFRQPAGQQKIFSQILKKMLDYFWIVL